ncbi:YpbS family protein [Bacillus salitolerans]|uniref:YpbS family protein n=1 Tax=Bacillus salitolerans TaxID=1437434 RepID=A0ABW4LTG9_9BACI
MSVHKEISAHSRKQHAILKDFLKLDALRESYIEEAVGRCKQGLAFSTTKINEVTNKINELAKQGVVPQRQLVTEEMIIEYVERVKAGS